MLDEHLLWIQETALHNESFVRQAMPQVRFHVLIDWSGSCMRAPLEEAWQNVRAELPEVLMTYGITNLMISAFDEDGWCPRTIVALELPRLLVASSKPNPTTEWESFANIRDALREQEQATLAGEKAVAETTYRQKFHAVLAALDVAEILPPPARQSRRSDIVGLLERIAKTRSAHREYVLVLTDLVDTGHRELPSVAAPEREIYLAVLLVPAEPLALRKFTLEYLQHRKVVGSFDSFCDHVQAQIVCQGHDGRDNSQALIRVLQFGNEGVINLQRVDWKFLQITEGRITRAKVINRQFDIQSA